MKVWGQEVKFSDVWMLSRATIPWNVEKRMRKFCCSFFTTVIKRLEIKFQRKESALKLLPRQCGQFVRNECWRMKGVKIKLTENKKCKIRTHSLDPCPSVLFFNFPSLAFLQKGLCLLLSMFQDFWVWNSAEGRQASRRKGSLRNEILSRKCACFRESSFIWYPHSLRSTYPMLPSPISSWL